jgi:hypothetical protein
VPQTQDADTPDTRHGGDCISAEAAQPGRVQQRIGLDVGER